MSERTNRLRLYRPDRIALKDLKEVDIVRERADTDNPTYDDVLGVIVPEDAIIERPEEDMVWVTVSKEIHTRINSAAGENVPVNEVINHYIERFAENHDIEL